MKIYAPMNVTSVSVHGININVVDGSIDVDAAVFEELKSHGFTDVPLPSPAQQKKADAAEISRRKELDLAQVVLKDAQAALFATEGRGDDKATAKARVALDAAEFAVKELS